MDFNRNQYFMIGMVVLLLGIQLRNVESYVLNEESSRFIEKRLKKKKQTLEVVQPASQNTAQNQPVIASTGTGGLQVIRPPRWLSWALISVGIVLILHSLAMKKPE